MPAPVRYRGRRAAQIENSALRLTVLFEGGHIAEILDKRTGVNPLWTPGWPSIEPSAYDRARHDVYGGGVDAQLLAGIMGHNLCLDIFGGPSAEEAAAGLPVHGEASRVRYDVHATSTELVAQAHLPLADLRVERRIELDGAVLRIRESVQNLGGIDKPIGWTQHVTLGPPFLKKGATTFRATATKSRVYESRFGPGDYLQPGAEFTWPHAPKAGGGGTADLRIFTDAPSSSAYTAHLMDPAGEHASFVAFNPDVRLVFGYIWRRTDFPWLGIWEENFSRTQAPWSGQSLTRGMEFGVSPFPESRREMIGRSRMFDTPTFRWIPAASRVSVEYCAVMRAEETIPDKLEWPL